MKQVIDNREMVDKLNDLNHDYQRMRKLAKRRRVGILNKVNKEKARQEKEARKLLGGEACVEVKGTWLEKLTWVAVGLLIGLWLH